MWLAFAAILLAPVIAMRFTREVNWTAHDFAFAALLLGALGLAVEVATRMLHRRAVRTAAIGLASLVAVLAWAEGAVGLFH